MSDHTGSGTSAQAGPNIEPILAELAALAPLGYAVALHFRKAVPLIMRSNRRQDWIDYYATHNYLLRDPMIFQALSMAGVCRWSEITLPDPFGVAAKAAGYGLHFGAICSCGPITSRSVVSVARGDREFDDAELERLVALAARLHDVAQPRRCLTAAQLEALLLLEQGERHADAARHLGITESALKARLQSARQRLGARSTREALRIARELHLI